MNPSIASLVPETGIRPLSPPLQSFCSCSPQYDIRALPSPFVIGSGSTRYGVLRAAPYDQRTKPLGLRRQNETDSTPPPLNVNCCHILTNSYISQWNADPLPFHYSGFRAALPLNLRLDSSLYVEPLAEEINRTFILPRPQNLSTCKSSLRNDPSIQIPRARGCLESGGNQHHGPALR